MNYGIVFSIMIGRSGPGQGPGVDRVKWDGSTAEIYNAGELFETAKSEPINIFDRADFGSPIERARLNLEPVLTTEGEPAVGVAALIQLDRSHAAISGLVEKFKQNFPNRHGVIDDDILAEQNTFTNVFTITDAAHNVRLAVRIGDDGAITVVNQNRFSNDTKKLDIHAPAAHGVDAKMQLKGWSRIFMRTLDHANSTTSRYNTIDRLERTYKIGEDSKPHTRLILPRSMGELTVQRTIHAPQPTPPKAPNISAAELGIDVSEQTKITLDDIGGLPMVKQQLRDIAVSFKNPEIMAKWGAKRPQGILLYGEPGTGKTMLVEALANEIGAKLWSIQGTDIYNMWLGESERKIKALFDTARSLQELTVILFDEFDSIIGTVSEVGPGGSGRAQNGVAGIFKQELNTLAAENPNVLLVATTNHPDRIDEALIRSGRFDHKVYVPMPDEQGRAEIISGLISKTIMQNADSDFTPYSDNIQIAHLTASTEGMSGADIAEIFRRLTMQKAMEEARTGTTSPITHEDIAQTVNAFKTEG